MHILVCALYHTLCDSTNCWHSMLFQHDVLTRNAKRTRRLCVSPTTQEVLYRARKNFEMKSVEAFTGERSSTQKPGGSHLVPDILPHYCIGTSFLAPTPVKGPAKKRLSFSVSKSDSLKFSKSGRKKKSTHTEHVHERIDDKPTKFPRPAPFQQNWSGEACNELKYGAKRLPEKRVMLYSVTLLAF